MSESRFDFLRELVKNVPDINVAEEQQTGEPESDVPLDLCQYSVSLSPPLAASRLDDRPIATTSGGQASRSTHTSYVPSSPAASSSSNNGNNSSGVFRNGNKRSHPSSSPSSSQHIQKQNSLDLSRLSTINTASHRPNYYTETSDTSSSVIQFSSSTHHATSEFSLLDYRPPKLSRLDSAPAILASNNTTITAVMPQCSSNRNHNVSQQSTPVITIDFSKGIPSGPGLYSSSLVRPPIPALMPIHTPTLASPVISPLKLQYPPDLISTPPAFVNIDVSKTPLVKIDYSKLDLSAPTSPTLPYTSKSTRRQLSSANTTGTGRKTKKPQTPVINIDLSNSFNLNVAPQMFKFCDASSTSTTTSANSNLSRAMASCTNTSSLDMDEDYDNI